MPQVLRRDANDRPSCRRHKRQNLVPSERQQPTSPRCLDTCRYSRSMLRDDVNSETQDRRAHVMQLLYIMQACAEGLCVALHAHTCAVAWQAPLPHHLQNTRHASAVSSTLRHAYTFGPYQCTGHSGTNGQVQPSKLCVCCKSDTRTALEMY